MKKFLAKAYIWFLLVILYAPIIFIIIFSFSESKVLGNWTGFSTNLYTNLFSPQAASATSLFRAIYNTLIIALISAFVSMILGAIAAIGIYNLRSRNKNVMLFLNSIPIINPDIITGVALFLLFVFLLFVKMPIVGGDTLLSLEEFKTGFSINSYSQPDLICFAFMYPHLT